jgi:O-antigen/teichoic acid export membrane protein
MAGVILIPVLTKTLGAYGYGLWSQASITISLVLIVLILGFDLSIPRLFHGKEFEKIRKDFYSIIMLVIAISALFSSLLFLFPEFLANAIFDGNVLIVRIVAIIIFVRCFERIFLAVFQAFREMKKYATIDIVSTLIETGLAITLVLLGYGIIGAIIAVLFVRLSLSITLFFLVRKKLPFKKPNLSFLKEYLKLGIPTIPGGLSHFVVEMSDRYVIGIFLGTTFVGYYVPGYTLGKIIPVLLGGLLAFVLLPSLSEFYEKKNIHMIKNLLNLSTKYFLLISIPSMIGILILGKSILLLFTTAEIAEEGYIILVLTAFVGILYGLYEIYKQTIFLEKKTKLLAIYWSIGAVINLMGNIIFVPKFGILAAGITTLISYLLVTFMVLYFSFKMIPFRLDYLSIGKIVF